MGMESRLTRIQIGSIKEKNSEAKIILISTYVHLPRKSRPCGVRTKKPVSLNLGAQTMATASGIIS